MHLPIGIYRSGPLSIREGDEARNLRCGRVLFAGRNRVEPVRGMSAEASSSNPGTGHGVSALVAALMVAVGLGYGRFAFSGVFPAMVSEGVLTVHEGTLAASVNYAGYLLGALLAVRLRPTNTARMCLWMLAATVLSLAALVIVREPWVIIGIRGLAGVVSAQILVGASQWLMEHRGHVNGAPVLFSGVGTGIFLSAEQIVAGQAWGAGLSSVELWGALAVGALVLSGLAAAWMDRSAATVPAASTSALAGMQPSLSAGQLTTIYGLGGFGYIITATYLPLFIKGALGQVNPVHVWALFGLGSVPSCFVWHALHRRLGSQRALRLNLAIQTAGVMLPALSPTAPGYLGSAVLVGGTFMGTVTICMSAGRLVAGTVKGNMLARLTVAYGTGQILGPLVANELYARSQSFSSSLVAAGVALGLGCLLCGKRGGAVVRPG